MRFRDFVLQQVGKGSRCMQACLGRASTCNSVSISWFISSLFIIRVPFSLLFGFSKGVLK